MKKFLLAMTVLSMMALSVACNRSSEEKPGTTEQGSGKQMEQEGYGQGQQSGSGSSDMGSGSATDSANEESDPGASSQQQR